MDLWIRSQDREVLTKVVDIYKDADTNEIWAYSDRLIKNCLGFYKTKERALEVLNEIQELLIDCSSLKISRLNLNNGYDDLKIPYEINTKVYQMPEE